MSLILAAFVPLLVALIGGLALTRILRSGANTRTADEEKRSARSWAVTCSGLIACGPVAHGAYACMRGEAIPMDAIFGVWFLLPLLWFLYDWHRTWQRLLAEGARQGYSVGGSASLLRFVTAGIVLMGFWLLLLSLSGNDLPPRFPLHSVQPTTR